MDDLDGGGGLMANQNICLASESDGDVLWVPIPSLGHSWGEWGESLGLGTKLFEKVFLHEFRNLKLFFKNSRFLIFLKSIFPARKGAKFLKMVGC